MSQFSPTPRSSPPRCNADQSLALVRGSGDRDDGNFGPFPAGWPVLPRHAPRLSRPDLAAITCYFNPCGCEALKRNYQRFAANLRTQQVPLYSIELAFDNQPFFLAANQTTIQTRGGDLLWQKERLLNLLLERVPRHFIKIAWLDADVCFRNPSWLGDASRALDQFPLIQLFEQAALLSPDGHVDELRNGVAFSVAHQLSHAKHFGIAHPGFAWAARRDLLRDHGLLDHHIGGGADSLMVLAAYGWWDHPYLQVYNRAMRDAWLVWAKPFHRDVKGLVGYIPGVVAHLWHGSRANRRYNERVQCLARHDFDPCTDLELDARGLWRWSSLKPGLHEEIKQYFFERREDQS